MTCFPPPKDVLLGLFEALAQEGRSPEVLSRFSRDESLATYLERLLAGRPGARLELCDLLADADKVLVILELQGGLPPSPGVAFLCQVVEGKILYHWPIPEMSDVL